MAQGYLGVASTGILEQGKKDQGVLMAMTKTLHSELGFGNPKAVHHEYFLDFPESQSIPRAKILAAPPVPASEEYNNGLIGLYSGDFLEFLGAQAAFEMDAKEMIHKIHEAARRYTTDPDALAYFHLHLWFEDAHVDWIVEAMRPHLKKELAHLKVSNGFYKELELKKRWLDGLYKFTFDGN
jgi:pyrroloquinoline quinone (PQQ) biosynthesis protein C